MTNPTPLAELSAAGVSIWLDDLSRERINSGGLQDLIKNSNVVGVTTNPTIFAGALAKGEAYTEQVATDIRPDLLHPADFGTADVDGTCAVPAATPWK